MPWRSLQRLRATTTKRLDFAKWFLLRPNTPPLNDEDAVEVPPATKRRLGLDSERSWIITTELNRFIWPGPDLRPTATGDYLYGYLPEKLMHLVLDQVKKHACDKRLTAIRRTE